jgi:hypothetical protein
MLESMTNKIFYTSSNSQLSDRNPLGEQIQLFGMVVGLIIKMAGRVLRLSWVSAHRIIYNEAFSEKSLIVY